MNDSKNKVLSGLIWKFGERISAQVVTFVVSIILARLLPTEAYGLITLVTIFITFANCVVTNGFGSALIQKKDADNTDFSSVLYFQLFAATVLYIILFFTSPLIASFFGDGYELDAIAAVALGGTSMSGGRGKITGTIAGVLIIAVLNNGMNIMNISSYYQQVVKAVVILVAVLSDRKR